MNLAGPDTGHYAVERPIKFQLSEVQMNNAGCTVLWTGYWTNSRCCRKVHHGQAVGRANERYRPVLWIHCAVERSIKIQLSEVQMNCAGRSAISTAYWTLRCQQFNLVPGCAETAERHVCGSDRYVMFSLTSLQLPFCRISASFVSLVRAW